MKDWIIFCLVFLAVLALLSFLFFKIKNKKTRPLILRLQIKEFIPGHRNQFYCIEYSYTKKKPDWYRLKYFDEDEYFRSMSSCANPERPGWRPVLFSWELMEEKKLFVENLTWEKLEEYHKKEKDKEEEAQKKLEKRRKPVFEYKPQN